MWRTKNKEKELEVEKHCRGFPVCTPTITHARTHSTHARTLLTLTPLQEQEEVEPGEEHSDGPALELPRLGAPREEGSDEEGAARVQDPLKRVRQVQEVAQSLKRDEEQGSL